MTKQKTLGKLKAEVQIVFNSFIRKRDEGKPCISCNENKPLECGHFFSVGSYDGLRFDEDNAHGESVYSNRFDESHLIPYRDNLLERIGKERFDELYKRAADYKKFGYKWSREELIDIKKKYQNLIKKL